MVAVLSLLFLTSCKQNNHNDTELKQLLQLADSVSDSSPEISDSIYRHILKLDPAEHSAIFARALLGASKGLLTQRNYDSATQLIENAGRIGSELNDTALILEYLNTFGSMHFYMGKNDLALPLFNKGLNLAQTALNHSKTTAFTINIGKIYLEKGEYTTALRILNEGLTSARKYKDIKSETVALHSLASLSAYMDDNEKAIQYIRQAIKLNKLKNDQQGYAAGMVNLGIYYKNIAKLDSALISYREAEAVFQSLNDTFNIVLARYNVGIIYKKQKQYTRAETVMRDIYSYCERKQIVQGQTYSMWALSSIYEETNRITEGLQLIDTAILLARRLNLINDLSGFYDLKHSLLARAGDYKEAYDVAQISREISDSLTGLVKQKEILELNAKYETERKDSENNLLRKDNQIKKSQLLVHRLGILAAVLVFTTSIILFIQLQRKMKHARQLADERSLRLEKENTASQLELEHAALLNKLKEEELNRVSIENELKSEQIGNLELQTGLKEQELVFQALAKAELTQLLQRMNDSLMPFKTRLARKKDQEEFSQVLSGISRETSRDPLSEFELLFRQLHPDFYEKLLNRCPLLSKSELHISAMIRLNLSTKDMASLVNLSISTIETNRYHIRKKLGLDQGENLTVYLMRV